MHDDIVVKDWSFINVCLQHLQNGFTFIGNGMNYPAQFDPQKLVKDKKIVAQFFKKLLRFVFILFLYSKLL